MSKIFLFIKTARLQLELAYIFLFLFINHLTHTESAGRQASNDNATCANMPPGVVCSFVAYLYLAVIKNNNDFFILNCSRNRDNLDYKLVDRLTSNTFVHCPFFQINNRHKKLAWQSKKPVF
jgi:hypothetical protein